MKTLRCAISAGQIHRFSAMKSRPVEPREKPKRKEDFAAHTLPPYSCTFCNVTNHKIGPKSKPLLTPMSPMFPISGNTVWLLPGIRKTGFDRELGSCQLYGGPAIRCAPEE